MRRTVQYILQGLLTLLFTALFYFTAAAQEVLSTALFAFGAVLGVALLFLDETVFSKRYAEQGVTGQVVMTRSLLFVLTLLPLGVFVTTSSGSEIGIGLLLLLLSGILIEMMSMRKMVDAFNQRFVSQLKNPWVQSEIYIYMGVIVFFWLLLLFKVFIV